MVFIRVGKIVIDWKKKSLLSIVWIGILFFIGFTVNDEVVLSEEITSKATVRVIRPTETSRTNSKKEPTDTHIQSNVELPKTRDTQVPKIVGILYLASLISFLLSKKVIKNNKS